MGNTRGFLNIHIYPTAFKHESRILRETQAIADLDFVDRVEIAAQWDGGLAERQEIDKKRCVLRLRPRMKILPHFLGWASEVMLRYLRDRPSVIHCHSISVLPFGVLLKMVTGAQLVYDTHELETEKPGMRGWRKAFAKILERALISWVDLTYVVGNSIGDWYRETYGLKEVEVIKNLPASGGAKPERTRLLREEFGIGSDELLFIYQGIFGDSRGIPLLLDVFSKCAPDRHIVFMGFGELSALIQQYASKHGNIHIRAAVPVDQILKYTSSADVGCVLFENTCLNYYYCLPNKFFEYMASGLPVIASDFPDLKGFVHRYDSGWTLAPESQPLLEWVNSVTRPEIEAKIPGALRCSRENTWEEEAKRLVEAFKRVSLRLQG